MQHTAREASELEPLLRRTFEDVDFAFEINPNRDEITEAIEALGAALTEPGASFLATIKRYPALTVSALAGHGLTSYDGGAYWETFWEVLGRPREQETEDLLRQWLEELLRRCNLAHPAGIGGGQKYLMMITLHAGLPLHCVDDLIDVLEEYLNAGRDPSGAEFVQWLTDPAARHRMNRLDLPVRNFIRHTDTLAVTTLDHIIEFGRSTLQNPEAWQTQAHDSASTGLPTLLLESVTDRFAKRPFLSGRPVAEKSIRRPSPVVKFLADDNEVVVELPFPAGSPDSTWKVSFAHQSKSILPMRGWGAAEDDQPSTPAAITDVARSVTVVNEGIDQRKRFDLFSHDDPVLFFNSNGRLVPTRSPIPRDIVYVLAPKDTTLRDSADNARIEPREQGTTPVGWKGWAIRPFDLSDVDGVYVERGSGRGRPHSIAASGMASIELPDPLPGVRTAAGQPVYSELPLVDIPADRGTKRTPWHVTTRRTGSHENLTDAFWNPIEDVAVADPFDGVEEVLLGSYEITVRRGVGDEVRQSLFIAEGLELDGADLRWPQTDGLSSAAAALWAENGLHVEPGFLTFDHHTRELPITVAVHGHEATLVVSPPCAEFRIDRVGRPAEWRTTPVSLSPHDFDNRYTLGIRVPGARAVTFALRCSDGDVRQKAPIDKPSAPDTFVVSSQQFTDTVQNLGEAELHASVIVARRESTIDLLLGRIGSAPMCRSISIHDGVLVFEGLADIEEPAAWVWACTAPWLPVHRVPIANGRAAIPIPLVDAGPLIVEPFADDSFVVVPRPQQPGRHAALVQQSGRYIDDSGALDALSQFLSKGGPLPAGGDTIDGVWDALRVLPCRRHAICQQTLVTTFAHHTRPAPGTRIPRRQRTR